MNKDELKELSAQTYYDNNLGEIEPEDIRNFNNELIDAVELDDKETFAEWTNCTCSPSSKGTAKVRAKVIKNTLLIVGDYMAPSSINSFQITNLGNIVDRIMPSTDSAFKSYFFMGLINTTPTRFRFEKPSLLSPYFAIGTDSSALSTTGTNSFFAIIPLMKQ